MSPPEKSVLSGTHLTEVVLRHGRRPPAEVAVLRGGSSRGLSRIVKLAEGKSAPLRWVDRDEMHRLTGRATYEIAAVLAEREDLGVADILPASPAPVLLVVLEGVEDPHNLGEILRTALAAGTDGVILEAHARGLPRDVVGRSSAAASECLPIVYADDLAETIGRLHAADVTTVAAEPTGGEDLFAVRFDPRTALVIGGERRGLSRRVAQACRRRLTIPTDRRVQSLSAVSSAAVVLFQVAAQRRGG